mmetsp:Transcript_204/g.519  ORF Transcript_204/g.519 Transcript_204/m.519 type:complete len:203 (+) Transcript_204:190-798(+)
MSSIAKKHSLASFDSSASMTMDTFHTSSSFSSFPLPLSPPSSLLFPFLCGSFLTFSTVAPISSPASQVAVLPRLSSATSFESSARASGVFSLTATSTSANASRTTPRQGSSSFSNNTHAGRRGAKYSSESPRGVGWGWIMVANNAFTISRFPPFFLGLGHGPMFWKRCSIPSPLTRLVISRIAKMPCLCLRVSAWMRVHIQP